MSDGRDELARAIAEASEGVTRAERLREGWAATAGSPRRPGPALLLVAALAGVVLVASVVPRHLAAPPPRAEQLADLRWSVAAVVRQVERHRLRHGRLPRAVELAPLLTEAVHYIPAEDGYQVVGQLGLLRVGYDSREMAAELWLQGAVETPPPEPPS